MIEVKNLVKRYGNHVAVNGISFTVEPGKIYGLLGPNGAGKSTTMNIVTGCLAANEGSVTINGHDIFENPKEAKRCIGYLPEIPPLYSDMTPIEYLTFVAEAKKVKGQAVAKQVKEVMEVTDLTAMQDRLIRNLSKGYRQRVGIAQAMLGDPDIIILDEPTVGLDPKQILEIRELIKALGKSKTVILSSHILAEISAVCENVMIISHGNLVANDSIENLEAIANRCDKLKIIVRGERNAIVSKISSIENVLSINDSDEKAGDGEVALELELLKGADIRNDIFFAMADIKYPIISIHYQQTTLEDIFLALTNDNIHPDKNGVMPSVEDILSGKAAKYDEDSYENNSDEELEDLTDEDSENKEEQEDDYRPLFSGENKEEEK
ncbi:MAG: ATP-binding cassette domain-containing protein [Clostridia bacterium]|nr:ATP-binding cassette domain-containing protein [Clostridia bacterium]